MAPFRPHRVSQQQQALKDEAAPVLQNEAEAVVPPVPIAPPRKKRASFLNLDSPRIQPEKQSSGKGFTRQSTPPRGALSAGWRGSKDEEDECSRGGHSVDKPMGLGSKGSNECSSGEKLLQGDTKQKGDPAAGCTYTLI